jgi:hypothetical protein
MALRPRPPRREHVTEPKPDWARRARVSCTSVSSRSTSVPSPTATAAASSHHGPGPDGLASSSIDDATAQPHTMPAVRDLRPYWSSPAGHTLTVDPTPTTGAFREPEEVEMFTVRVRDVMTAPAITVVASVRWCK